MSRFAMRGDIKTKGILALMTLLGIALILIFLYLGQNIHSIYYTGWIALLPLGYVGLRLYKKWRISLVLEGIRKEWGEEVKKDYDLKEISRLFRYINNESEVQYIIDDQTWNDLNMNDIFAKIDRTVTVFGEQMLYNMLRTPLLQVKPLLKRSQVINLFQNNQAIREDLLLKLERLGSSEKGFLSYLIWDDVRPESRGKWVYYTLPIILLGALLLTPYFGMGIFIRIVAPVFALSIYIYYRTRRKMGVFLDSIGSLGSFLVIAREIGDMKTEELILQEYTVKLKNACTHCNRIMKKTRILEELESRDPFGINEYIKILTFMDIKTLLAVLEDLEANREHLQEIYKTLGELDALLSVASYRSGLLGYSEPDFLPNENWVDLQGMKHPLLRHPVSNAVRLEKGSGLIVTGSNMSGKSTFMRTVGINVLFAQTIYTCLADTYKGGFFRIMTSISQEDNIIGGKSYFLSEAESLLRILNGLDHSSPVLCIIDEIFRGTNSEERIGAATRLLNYFVKQNAAIIVATHDLELTQTASPSYRCCHFSEKVGQTGLEFDYKLKEGVSTTRNALKILGFLGYPSEIVDREIS